MATKKNLSEPYHIDVLLEIHHGLLNGGVGNGKRKSNVRNLRKAVAGRNTEDDAVQPARSNRRLLYHKASIAV